MPEIKSKTDLWKEKGEIVVVTVVIVVIVVVIAIVIVVCLTLRIRHFKFRKKKDQPWLSVRKTFAFPFFLNL